MRKATLSGLSEDTSFVASVASSSATFCKYLLVLYINVFSKIATYNYGVLVHLIVLFILMFYFVVSHIN